MQIDMDPEKKEGKKGVPVAELVTDFVQACQSSIRSETNTVAWNHLELEGAGRGVSKLLHFDTSNY